MNVRERFEAVDAATNAFLLRVHHGWIVAALFVLHACFVLPLRYPTAMFDEFGYLSYARVFAGAGIPPNLESLASQPFLYGLTISPALFAFQEFFAGYKVALLLNCVLMALAYPGIFYLARRLGGLGRPAAIAVGVATSCYASALLFPSYTVSEALFLPLFVWTACAFVALLDRPQWPRAVSLGILCALLYATHQSGAIVIGAAVVALALAVRRRTLSVTSAAAFAGALIVSMIVVGAEERRMLLVLYHRETEGGLAHAAAAALHPDQLLSWLRAIVCQLFAITVSTFGLFTIGLWGALRRVRDAAYGPFYLFAALAGAGSILGSAAFLTAGAAPPPEWINFYFAVRYCEHVALVLVPIGFLVVADPNRRAAAVRVALGVLAVSAVIALPGVQHPEWFDGVGRRMNMLAFTGMVQLFGRASVWTLLATGAVVAAALFALQRARMVWWYAVFAAAGLVLAFQQLVVAYVPLQYIISQDGERFEIPNALRDAKPGTRVAYDVSALNPLEYAFVQLLEFDVPLDRFDESGAVPPDPYVVAPAGWKSTSYSRLTCEHYADQCLWQKGTRAATAAGPQPFDYAFQPPAVVRTKGLYPIEGEGDDRFRWTNGDATLTVASLPRDARGKRLTLRLYAFEKTPVTVSFDGRVVRRFDVNRETVQTFAIAKLPKSVRIQSATFVPVPTNGYTRTLGVEVRQARLEP